MMRVDPGWHILIGLLVLAMLILCGPVSVVVWLVSRRGSDLRRAAISGVFAFASTVAMLILLQECGQLFGLLLLRWTQVMKMFLEIFLKGRGPATAAFPIINDDLFLLFMVVAVSCLGALLGWFLSGVRKQKGGETP